MPARSQRQRRFEMRRPLRRWPAIAAALVIVVATAAVATVTASARPTTTITIGYIAPLANSYVQGELAGIAQVLKANPNVKLVKIDTGFDATKEYNAVQDAITGKTYDGLIVLPLDSVGLVPAVQQAIKAG